MSEQQPKKVTVKFDGEELAGVIGFHQVQNETQGTLPDEGHIYVSWAGSESHPAMDMLEDAQKKGNYLSFDGERPSGNLSALVLVKSYGPQEIVLRVSGTVTRS